ncbi:predicted protein [Nematostella vectensis]|uniref:Uncharacterized protein n=1 Tax=Nematostella vectensis TaxID=45351 RepID=A7TBG6_NEMVE|nr:predicted protein [Nematostella vectensis]|eukprot:XP_001618741.1 hypothetical protein NEMVEDRAFT_v1g224853 [Nematostella vectensis]
MMVSEKASEYVKVVLSADGGDEIFAGYDKHQWAIDIFNKRKMLNSFPFKILLNILSSKVIVKLANFFNIRNFNTRIEKIKELVKKDNLVDIMCGISQYISDSEIKKWMKEVNENDLAYFKNYSPKSGNQIDDMLYVDIKTHLPDQIMTKVDKATMYSSIEGREPLLDYRIIEKSFSLSNDLKIVSKKHTKRLLKVKASLMLSWLSQIKYKNGAIPMVNDSSYGITVTTKEIFEYAEKLNINKNIIPLRDSGYRKIVNGNYELFIDVGDVGPDFQPGHAHSDTFNFELYYDKKPIIVDTGISTYEKNERRHLERVTSSHNTVKIGTYEQSQVWGGFRVGKRAKIVKLIEEPRSIIAVHDGYKDIGFLHTRSFKWTEDSVIIQDNISKETSGEAKAYFHFAENIDFTIKRNKVLLDGIQFIFEGVITITSEKYLLAKGFNQTTEALKLIVTFNQKLITKISL